MLLVFYLTLRPYVCAPRAKLAHMTVLFRVGAYSSVSADWRSKTFNSCEDLQKKAIALSQREKIILYVERFWTQRFFFKNSMVRSQINMPFTFIVL